MAFPFLGLFSVIGTGLKGFFGFKAAQGEAVNKALDSLSNVSKSDAAYVAASAKAIEAVYTHGSPFERLWRPAAMWTFLVLIVARFFGFVPVGLTESEVNQIYIFFEIGLIGYMPLRSLDKWMKGFQIGSILKNFIQKKIV